MEILLFSGSLRKDSLNKKLVLVAQKMVQAMPSNSSVVADLQSLALPVYDGDIETQGIPDGVKTLGKMIEKCGAIIISTPEYNGSIAGSLKNTIDWISRLRPVPFTKKPVLLLGASPGALAALRGLGVTRAPLEQLGCFVYPQVFGLGKADQAFQANGDLVDLETQKRLTTLVSAFLDFAQKLNGG